MSAFEHVHGKHCFDATPFHILGCKVEIHVTPRQTKTWDTHTKTGYYIGPAWEPYRCHEVWSEETKATRVGQTVFFKHKYITAPQVTATDALLRASDDLCNALLNVEPNDGRTKKVVDLLMEIFKGKANEEKTGKDARRTSYQAAQEQRV